MPFQTNLVNIFNFTINPKSLRKGSDIFPSAGTKKAGSDACFFRIPERKNFRTIHMGFAYDYEIDNLIQIFDNDLNGFTIFECVDSDLDIARYKLE